MDTPRHSLPSARWITRWVCRALFLVAAVHVVAFETVLHPIASLAIAVVAGGIGILDARWRDETLFLASLGLSPHIGALVWAGTVLMAEAALFLLSPLLSR
jgi:hypothetical protein